MALKFQRMELVRIQFISSSQIVSPKWKLELLPLCHSVMGFQTEVMSPIGGGVWSTYEHT